MANEVSKNAEILSQEMNALAAVVQSAIKTATSPRATHRLTKDAAALAALIGVISYIRVDGLNEDALLREARKAVPRDRFMGHM